MPGGQPSITHPIAGPWDSPKVVTVKSVPRVLPDILERRQEELPMLPEAAMRAKRTKLGTRANVRDKLADQLSHLATRNSTGKRERASLSPSTVNGV